MCRKGCDNLRKRVGGKSDRAFFTRTAKATRKINLSSAAMRGGIRL